MRQPQLTLHYYEVKLWNLDQREWLKESLNSAQPQAWQVLNILSLDSKPTK